MNKKLKDLKIKPEQFEFFRCVISNIIARAPSGKQAIKEWITSYPEPHRLPWFSKFAEYLINETEKEIGSVPDSDS